MVNADTIKEKSPFSDVEHTFSVVECTFNVAERRFNVAEYKRSLGLILFSAIPLLSKDRYLYI